MQPSTDDDRPDPGQEWLTLGQARRLLGVSEPTLRKWTDEGRVNVFVTPGGHRRYRTNTIHDLALEIRRHRALGIDLGTEYERELDDRHSALARYGWYERLDEADRVRMRVRGLAVLTALEDHIEGKSTEDRALLAMEDLGRAYGMDLVRLGLSPREMIEAFRVFRGSVMEAIRRIAERPGRRRGLSGLDAMQQASSMLDEMAIAIVAQSEPAP